jgi:tripartite-type tricarboxylate transporter receptor subunit TctC
MLMKAVAAPAEIVDKLNKEINAALADPKLTARLADLGGVPMSMTAAEFGRSRATRSAIPGASAR